MRTYSTLCLSLGLVACGTSNGPATAPEPVARTPETVATPPEPRTPEPVMTAPAADGFSQAAAAGAPAQARAPSPEPAASAAVGGAAPSGPPAALDPPRSSCRERYSLAMRTRMDMSWPDSIGALGGQGKLWAWGKITHTPSANGTSWEQVPCGVKLPVVTTTPLLDNIQLANEMPTSAFDNPSMPRSRGMSTWQDKLLTWDSVTLLGSMLSDPRARWPVRRALVLIDHDADGKPGITAIPKTGAGFGLPPIDVGQTQHADQVYVTSRVAVRVRATSLGCDERAQGEVEPLSFDYTIVGCRGTDAGNCPESSVNLLANNSPEFTLGSKGEWTSAPIAESATCVDVVAALPAE